MLNRLIIHGQRSKLLHSVIPNLSSWIINPSSAYKSSNNSANKNLGSSQILSCQWPVRCFSYETVKLVLSEGKPRFEIEKEEPCKRRRYLTKKRLKEQRMKEKRKRKEANKNDPRRLTPKGKKKHPTVEARLKYKIERAKIKEALLVEKLKKYEVPKAQGPMVEPENLTGEEQFYLKKMAQKGSNYVPIGRRGIFGGVILNMHTHFKKHETVKVICKPCKPGQIHEYASELARLSGGTPVNIIGNDTVVFYRGKNYEQPQVMSPVDTLSKKKALEKSKYEQSLETVRRFIAISEKELELYYRHVALYGDPQYRNADLVYGDRKPFSKIQVVQPDQTREEGCHPDDQYSISAPSGNGNSSSSGGDTSVSSDVEACPDSGGVFIAKGAAADCDDSERNSKPCFDVHGLE